MELRALCDDESVAFQRLGTDAADALKHRLADIRAADSIDDVVAGRPQRGKYLDSDCIRFELAGSHQLTVVPNHAPPRNDAHGHTVWDKVRRVRVVALEPLP
jgi:hypothetical protein